MQKQKMMKNATSILQRDEIDRRIEIASHKTKSAIAFSKGDLQRAFLEFMFAYNKQRHY